MKLKLLICSVALTVGLCRQSSAELVTALTQSNQLVNFDTATPGTTSSVAVTNLIAGDMLSSIDRRPANGQLYGFSVNGTTGRLYSINSTTGVAELSSTLSTALNGSFFGVDFNPVVDRLRVVSNAGQNLSVRVENGLATAQTSLQYAAGDDNAGTPPQVIASAYSNNVASAGSTTLYGMDLSTNSLVTQSPPSSGLLNTVGSLSGVLFPEAAFDISGVTGIAYAILNGFELAQVNLATGATTSLGAINAPGSLIGLAAPVGVTAVPEPGSVMLVMMGVAGWYGARRCKRSVCA